MLKRNCSFSNEVCFKLTKYFIEWSVVEGCSGGVYWMGVVEWGGGGCGVVFAMAPSCFHYVMHVPKHYKHLYHRLAPLTGTIPRLPSLPSTWDVLSTSSPHLQQQSTHKMNYVLLINNNNNIYLKSNIQQVQ